MAWFWITIVWIYLFNFLFFRIFGPQYMLSNTLLHRRSSVAWQKGPIGPKPVARRPDLMMWPRFVALSPACGRSGRSQFVYSTLLRFFKFNIHFSMQSSFIFAVILRKISNFFISSIDYLFRVSVCKMLLCTKQKGK